MGKALDLVGARFGRLLAQRRIDNAASGAAQWLCSCDCGLPHHVIATKLVNGEVRSCGCIRKELASTRAATFWALHPERKLTPEERKRRGSARHKSWYVANRDSVITQAADWKRRTGYGKRQAADLTDSYVRGCLSRQLGIDQARVPMELISIKREQLLLHRLARELKQAATKAKDQP